jgi:hypothetical protein
MLGLMLLLVACTPTEKATPVDALKGAWVLSVTSRNARGFLYSQRVTPMGFDFSSTDSAEVFCAPREGERYTTYRISNDTLGIGSAGAWDWMKFRYRIRLDTLFLFRETDTVTYMRVNMSDFKPVSIERVYLSAGSWSWIVGLTFSKDGSMEVMSNGYQSHNRNPYKINKIYKLNRSPVPFESVSRSVQKLHYIAQSERGRQLYDSAGESCFDGTQYSILWESDSLRERTYSSCRNDFEFFKYAEYLIWELELDAQRVPMKMVAYDSILDSPIFYCGHLSDSANQRLSYTISEQLYIARHLRSGTRSTNNHGPFSATLLNYCGSEGYAEVLRTDGRVFQITTDQKTYYIDAGKDLLGPIKARRKNNFR